MICHSARKSLRLLWATPNGKATQHHFMIITFSEIRHLIPMYIFNEFGQLTGHYVYGDQIICERTDGRIKIWLNQESFDAQDPERLICDYDEDVLRGLK